MSNMSEKPLCVHCKQYTPDSPYDHHVQKHWCRGGVNLIEGGTDWVACGVNRSAYANILDTQGVAYDLCGPDGKHFVRWDT